MPFNPRRQKIPDRSEPELTSEQIADAMERAVELRRKTMRDPNDVGAIGLTVSEATRSTKSKRPVLDWDGPPDPSPWVMVGWVKQVIHRELVGDRYWEVWLNVDDDRVWLKQSRWGR